MGFILAALLAGYRPKIRPMIKQNTTATRTTPPSKAKTIGKYLGDGYEVLASMGHVRDLPKSKIGVDIESGFVPAYQPIKGKEDIISQLKKLGI